MDKPTTFQFYPCSRETTPNKDNCKVVRCTIRKSCKVKGKKLKDPKHG